MKEKKKRFPRNCDPVYEGRKFCPKCKETLEVDKFCRSRLRRNGYQLWCKECGRIAKYLQYHMGGAKEQVLRNARSSQLRRQYNLSIDDYEAMLTAQNGACWICEKPETVRSNPKGRIDSLRVDHCHTTNRIRGLLCSACNFGISQFKDNTALLGRAIDYLNQNENRP